MSVASFIATQRARFHVPHATSCRALGVSQAWFYKWAHGDPSRRHARREQLRVEIARLFAAHKGRYGSPRICADLRDLGWAVSVNTVAQMMAELGLRARPPRPEGSHSAGPGSVAGSGPSGKGFHRGDDQPEVVR